MEPEPQANPPVRHHYVPRGYLAQFTPERTAAAGRIWACTRDASQAPARVSLKNVAYEDHLYTVPNDQGEPSTDLERRFAREIEGPFLSWQRGVVRARRGYAAAMVEAMSAAQRTDVARYVAYQHLRTPAQRLFDARMSELAHHTHFADPQTRAACEAAWRRWGRNAHLPLTAAERRIEIERWMTGLEALARRWRDARPHLWLRPLDRFAEGLTPSLVHERHWRLVELPDDVAQERPLITCDNPVVLARPRAGAGPDVVPGWDAQIGGGWEETNMEITLALSPKHALMLTRDADALALADSPARFATALRVRTARHALRHVYARDQDEEIVAVLRATRAPDVWFEVGGELLPSSVDIREVMRRVNHLGESQIGVRYVV